MGGNPLTVINTIYTYITAIVAALGGIYLIYKTVSVGLTGGRIVAGLLEAVFVIYFVTHSAQFVSWIQSL